MKRKLTLIFSVLVVLSCENDDTSRLPEINGRYTHDIPDCDNTANPEINCTEFMELINDSEVDLLYGGGDIVHRFSYTRKGNILDLQGPMTSSFKVSFTIKDSRTLIRVDNGDVWVKSE